jgi:hypothetical protein
LAGWRTELATELRGALIADREADADGIFGLGKQPRAGGLEADLLLKPDR